MEIISDNIDKISCMIGNHNIVFIIFQDLSIKSYAISLKMVEDEVQLLYFEKINRDTLINTKHLSVIKTKRTIELKNGMKLMVSRKKWNLFKLQNKR